MKLYANVSSERATKGQGGNEWLDVNLMVENGGKRVEAGRLSIRNEEEYYYIDFYEPNMEEGENLLTIEKLKGKKQKGEIKKGQCIYDHDHKDGSECGYL